MEDNRFDSLTRHVGRQTARRTMIKTAFGGTLALLGIGIHEQASEARRRNRNKSTKNRRSNQSGYEGDECASNDDCLKGLRCEGARTGIDPGRPTLIPLQVISGKPGTCRYQKGCGGEQGDACRVGALLVRGGGSVACRPSAGVLVRAAPPHPYSLPTLRHLPLARASCVCPAACPAPPFTSTLCPTRRLPEPILSIPFCHLRITLRVIAPTA